MKMMIAKTIIAIMIALYVIGVIIVGTYDMREAISLIGQGMMSGGLFVFFYKIGLVIDKYLSDKKKD